ncbi:FtsX-like permease family protein [Flavisolibacter ginsengisoli]|uniref:Lipoprotein-releasing system permease protein n=1 Tax=Flavisolibacter ginsengisoli DSM 18119 TaxID=1121884 RepID=A0A1M4W1Y0_9BACT|nr:FtsX-like permease family protein [Flavisolibacter ginsengisoli]SHE75238.1 lipoprotein-releasing system permease protein [Flavisolibacter ginsengisoli DSM 18119]
MNFLFAWRYFKAKKSTNSINVISWISILAIVIGTASLILVLSVFNGFEGLVKSLYSSFYPDLKVSPLSGKEMVLTQEQLQKLRSVKGVRNVSLVVEEKALLKNGDYQTIVSLKGVDDNYTAVTNIRDQIVKGDFNTGTADDALLVLGAGIESAVGVQTDRNLVPLAIYLPRKGEVSLSDPFKSLSVDTINTSGTFLIQQDFDNKYALTNLAFVKNMLGMNADTYGGAEIAIDNRMDADAVQQMVKDALGKQYIVLNRYEQNASLFSVMQVEKWMIYAILSLILVVAAFNMIGALTMLVLEKKQDISVLHALGADRSFIQRIFLTSGLLLAFLGGGAGMLLAFIIGTAQTKFHLVPLEGNTFMVNYFPVKMVYTDFILVSVTVIVIALIASWIPARKAAAQQFILRSE